MRSEVEQGMMELAIEEMDKSSGRGPKVGAVLVQGGRVIGAGHKRPGVHAERAAIESAFDAGESLKGSILFTTLEPCVSVTSSTTPCSQLIVEHGIRTVYIGRFDPNPTIYRAGWKHLRDAGVTLYDFPAPLRTLIDAINQQFIDHFVSGVGPLGGAKFDYQVKRGRFEIQFSSTDERSIVTE
jgi:diaminohydroxyphosphoribosylaminopyrimidine deaminase / 5-amino-6-(5-phosphoribosylamino)uracil reductase